MAEEKLPPLPASTDDSWQEAESVPTIDEPIAPNHEHYFLRVRSNEAQCRICNWGLFIDPLERVDDGHIYDQNGTIAI